MPDYWVKSKPLLERSRVLWPRSGHPPSGMLAEMMFDYLPDEWLLQASVPLREIIDTDLLVADDALRAEGIDPGAVRVVLAPKGVVKTDPGVHLIYLDERTLKEPEYVYATVSHELQHHFQELSGELPYEERQRQRHRNPSHSARPYEMEAFLMEALQGKEMGWTKADYDRYLHFLYPRWAGLVALRFGDVYVKERTPRYELASRLFERRRPVHVRGHGRRSR